MQIAVLGIGGGGTRAVGRMVQHDLRGPLLAAVDTDSEALQGSYTRTRVLIGEKLTHGLGAGGDPAVGACAAEESAEQLRQLCSGADIVFIVTGLGGGTGTGASCVLADIAKNCGALTVGVVSIPFAFEGPQPAACAREGQARLQELLHAVITIPSEGTLQQFRPQLVEKHQLDKSVENAFLLVNHTEWEAVSSIVGVALAPGLANYEPGDLRSFLSDAGRVAFATAHATGRDRAAEAARYALTSTMLDFPVERARSALVSIWANEFLGLDEVHQVVDLVKASIRPPAHILCNAGADNLEPEDDALGVDLFVAAGGAATS